MSDGFTVKPINGHTPQTMLAQAMELGLRSVFICGVQEKEGGVAALMSFGSKEPTLDLLLISKISALQLNQEFLHVLHEKKLNKPPEETK